MFTYDLMCMKNTMLINIFCECIKESLQLFLHFYIHKGNRGQIEPWFQRNDSLTVDTEMIHEIFSHKKHKASSLPTWIDADEKNSQLNNFNNAPLKHGRQPSITLSWKRQM